MSSAIKNVHEYPVIQAVKVTDDAISVSVSDGRVVSVPLVWFPRLSNAEASHRQVYVISPSGYGIHWPIIDEDISIKAFLDTQPIKVKT